MIFAISVRQDVTKVTTNQTFQRDFEINLHRATTEPPIDRNQVALQAGQNLQPTPPELLQPEAVPTSS
ncbi:hypothetical protein HMPREF1981_02618 [Bacteroides pyogenes F0041]|uniref:Uncharacterized protein n=1 Tax=Bacteroides pyogenes F0041 TaxID=1321819 RepID=U2CI50_9BACE|nr:hypothetical protein HMPREF1981_02618 [Bacteroides pyogenes F0041]